MRRFRNLFVVQLLFFILVAGCSDRSGRERGSQSPSRDTSKAKVTVEKLELPPRFLAILRQEMNQLSGGMGAMLSYMVRGQGQEAAEVAMSIHNSFILKQELTEEELKELVSLLPEGFIQLDRGFHQLADEMAAALKNEELEKSGRIYGQMVDACLNCHAQFATERFPAFKH